MAYTMKFKTLWGNDCEVVVTPAGGGSGTLIATSEPFEMETDDSTDIDTTLRATTGTLRFIVPEGGEEVLDAILPSTLLGTKVEVYLTDAGTSTRVCKFAGYVELTEYSQPWDSAPYEMELPVRDALSIMEEVRMEVGDATLCETMNVASVIYEAFESVGIEPAGLHMESTTQEELNTLMQREWLLEKATEEEGGETTTYMRGMLWSDIIERVLLPLGYTMWMEEGYVRLRRRSVPSLVYTFSWDEVKDIAGGSSAGGTLNTIDILAMRDALTNMSTGNTRGYVPGAARVLLKEKLDEVAVFEFDDDFMEWSLAALSYTSGGETVWEWHGTTTQRGVEVNRIYVSTTSLDYYYVPASKGACYSYETLTGQYNPVFGGLLCDLEGYKSDEAADQASLPVGKSAGVIFPVMNGRDYADVGIDIDKIEELGEETAVLSVKGSVLVDTRKEGCLCIEGKLKITDTSNDTIHYPNEVSAQQIATCLMMQVKLTSKETGAEYILSVSRGWREADGGKYYGYLYFDENGEMVMNANGKITKLAYRYDGDNSSYNVELSGPKLSKRFRYKDISGFIIPLDEVPGSGLEGLYEVSVKFYALADWEADERVRNNYQRAAHRLMYYYYLLTLSDVKVKWCPLCVSGTLPEPEEESGGNYDAKYIEVPDERTYVCTYKGENGEDEEIDFDTWGDSDGLKWGNTVQPNMLKKDVWDAASKQYTRRRRTVEYDDARLTEEVPKFYIDGGISLIKIGGTWQAWNEGGRKKFVEIL